jgi:hypothetical protein
MNVPSEASHMVRVPNRSVAQPVSGTIMVIGSRYPVITHCTVAAETAKSRPIRSRATLAIVESNPAASAPSIRARASLTRAGSRRSRFGAAGREMAVESSPESCSGVVDAVTNQDS